MDKILNALRHLIILPVIGSVILAIGAAIMGIGRIYTGMIYRFSVFDFSAKTAKAVSIAIIEIIDLFLVATVSYIAAVGLYKLFINKDFKLPGLMKIASLNDLESKIIGVIAAALAVAFLGEAAAASGAGVGEEVFYYGGGIAFVISALALFVKLNSGPDEKKDGSQK
jgi:uncharacterized membrane protein YqhA